MVQDLAEYLRGWIGYFGRCQTPEVLDKLEKCSDADFGRWSGSSGNENHEISGLRKRGIAAQEAAKTAVAPMDRGTLRTRQR